MRTYPLAAFCLCAATLFVGHAAFAQPLVTYATGDDANVPGSQFVYRIAFDPNVANSGVLSVAVEDTTPFGRFDNIDFVPGTTQRVLVTTQSGGDGSMSHYNVTTGAELAPFIASTNAITTAPASSQPASFVDNPAGTHIVYVENQFGFNPLAPHRLIQTPAAPGGAPQAVVFDGADGALPGLGFSMGLTNFSGTEIIGDTMYFFARDPNDAPDTRALFSIGLTPAGVWDGATITKEIAGLSEGPAPGAGPGASDGSDELDFDPVSGLLFGTNIITGEIVALDPGVGPVTSPGAVAGYFIDETQVLGGAADGLGLLLREIDGVRPDGLGNLIIIGHDGVLMSVDVDGVLSDGADDGDVIGLIDVSGQGIRFDDHTPTALAVPEPATVAIWLVLTMAVSLAYAARRRR